MAKRSHPVQVWTFEVWTFDMSVPSALDAEELHLFVSCIASNFEISGVGNLLAFFHVDRLSVPHVRREHLVSGWMLGMDAEGRQHILWPCGSSGMEIYPWCSIGGPG